MAGEQPGLVSAPVERQARFIDLTSFEQQPGDRLSIAGPLGLPLGGLVVVAAVAQHVVLQLDQQPGDLVVELLGLEPSFALEYLVYFLMVVSVGGAGSVPGTALAALVLGLFDVAGKYYAPELGGFIIYALMIVLLMLFPMGLRGRRV